MTTYIAPREKLFGHLDRLHELQTFGHTEAPINVEIDLSNRCSLGCKWCHFAYTHTKGPLAGKVARPNGWVSGGDLMATELAYRIVDQLVEVGARSITWTGGGEPTLHPDFDVIIAYAAAAGIAQGVYTHGGHIDKERARKLKKRLTFIYVSLDAATQAAYKRDKGVDRFDQACEGIRNLTAYTGGATVGVGFLVTAENWQDIPAMGELAEELGADYAQFRPTILFDQKHPDMPAENTAWMSDAIKAINKASYYNPSIVADTDRFRMYQNWSSHGYQTCWWSMLQTAITPNGKVWACVNKREHAAAEIGDLSMESFAEVWAAHVPERVGSDCRVMCRGHMSNLALDEIFQDRAHPEFV